MKKQNKHSHLAALTKESPTARKQRVTAGPKYRPTVFASKKRRCQDAKPSSRELLALGGE